ncbi:MAG: AI-2E family transporter [Patescibacteria group bacterium]
MSTHTLTIPHAFFLLLTAGVAFLFWKIIAPFAMVLVTAGVLAIILAPLDDRLRRLVKHKRLSALIMALAVLLVLVVPLFLISIVMIQQATDIVQRSFGEDGWFRSIDLTTLPIISQLPEVVRSQINAIDLPQMLKGVAGFALENIAQLFASTARLVFNTFLFFIAFFYILVDRERIYHEVLTLSPLSDSVDKNIIHKIVQTARAVVLGSLIVALVQAIIATIGMTIFGVPGALIWGALVIVAAQVPMLGVGLVMIPAVVYLFIIGENGAGLGLLIWSLTAVGLVDNLLQPLLIQGKTRMHALLILISILGGLQLFGPIGLILGPTILAAFLVILELYKSGILEK